ncbi:MAG: DUF4012 domain-containing protein, partial [Mycobacterium sp.]
MSLADDDGNGRRRLVLGGLVALLLLIVFGCGLGLRTVEAESGLQEARDNAQDAKDALLKGDAEGATRFAAAAKTHAQEARDATHSIPWTITAAVP